jgi:hypothetical protein
VDQVWEQDRILDKEDGDVVTHNVWQEFVSSILLSLCVRRNRRD